MAIVVDTCSLVAIARYYMLLDKKECVATFLRNQFSSGELILLDTILTEASYTSKGIALEAMPFLADKGLALKTSDMVPSSPRKFDNLLDNNFCVRVLKNELTEEEYIQQKSDFLVTGDAKILVYSLCYQHEHSGLFDDYCVMTEETRLPNDGKLFKKLPLLCDVLHIKTITLVDYLQENGFVIGKENS